MENNPWKKERIVERLLMTLRILLNETDLIKSYVQWINDDVDDNNNE